MAFTSHPADHQGDGLEANGPVSGGCVQPRCSGH